jgi:uncharacterized membrane protein
MKITKGTAFLLSLSVVFIMFAASAAVAWFSWLRISPEYRKTELLLPFIGTFVAAVVSLAAGFFGFNVADNGVKGKFFNQGLSDKKE